MKKVLDFILKLAVVLLEELYDSIPIGKENAISKERLQEIWGLTNERSARRTIAELRKMDNGDNFVIVSLSNCNRANEVIPMQSLQAWK